jgi:hypothetical protein
MLFLNSYYTEDNWGRGLIVELLDMKNATLIKEWDFREPWNWNGSYWNVLKGILISEDVETAESMNSIESSYQVDRKLLIINPNVVIDDNLKRFLINLEELNEGDIARLRDKNFISKDKYINFIQKKFKKIIKNY